MNPWEEPFLRFLHSFRGDFYFWRLRSFLLIEQCPHGVTTPRDLTLSESRLAKGGFEPLTMRSMRKNLTTELSWHPRILHHTVET